MGKTPFLSLAFCVASALHSLPVLAASCSNPASLVNGLTVELPCVQFNGQVYRTGLNPLPSDNSQLAWQWNGVLEAAGCDFDASVCTVLGSDMSLSLNSLTISGSSYQAQLAHAPDLNAYAWRYQSHSQKTTTPSTGDNSALNTALVEGVRTYMTQSVGVDKKVPGAVIGIASGSTTLLVEAYGLSDVASNSNMSTDNLLHIGSTNKALTSFLIAVLADQGVLTWDTKAQDIYPAFTTANPATAATITLRHLVNMTSGLPRESGQTEISEPARQLFANLSTETLGGAPGERYEYSNLSISLAAYLAVMAVAKQDHGSITETDLDNLYTGYVDLLKAKVLTPLGMTHSYIPAVEARATGLMAKSHTFVNGAFQVSESVEPDMDNNAPSGGLKSTAADMLRFMITDMQQGVTPENTQIASTAAIAERQQVSTGAAAAQHYGLGLEILDLDGVKFVGHAGSFDNFNSMIGFFPDKKIAFVLLTNGDSDGAGEMTNSGFRDVLANIIAEQQ